MPEPVGDTPVPGLANPRADGPVLTWGHVGATSGPRSTGSQRTTPVTIGQTTAQLTEQTRPSAAAHRDRPAVPDMEEVMPAAGLAL
jgi:hypothetical protein